MHNETSGEMSQLLRGPGFNSQSPTKQLTTVPKSGSYDLHENPAPTLCTDIHVCKTHTHKREINIFMHDEECLKGQDSIEATCFQTRDTGVWVSIS